MASPILPQIQSTLLKDVLQCRHEWKERLDQLRENRLPALCNFRSWGSDFNHGQSWKVSPVIISNRCSQIFHGMDPDLINLSSLVLKEVYPVTYRTLDYWISSNLINYIAYSSLPPGAVLKAHKHHNMGCAKIHVALEKANSCGLMYFESQIGGKRRRIIHQWSHEGQYCVFDDNLLHSAWNKSGDERVIVVIDFRLF